MKKIQILLIFSLVLFAWGTSASHHNSIVQSSWSDWKAFLKTWTWVNFIAIFGNWIWYIASPWIGGYAIMKAYQQYDTNPSLYNFLGYTHEDFYIIGM